MMPNLFVLVAAVAVCVSAFDVWSQAGAGENPGPFDLRMLWTYAWIVVLSLIGGCASFYQKVRKGQARWVNLNELIGELLTSALAGLLTYWVCRATGLGDWWTAALVGIGGHMGSRALFLLERLLERRLERIFGNGATQDRAGNKGDR